MAEINNGLPPNPIPVEYNNLDVSNLPSELVQDEKISPALKAYDTAYGLYNSKPEDQLTPAQKASREWVQEKTQKIISSGDKLNHKNYFSHNGHPYSMQEFLPTDDLVDFLSIEIDTLKKLPNLAEDAIQNQINEYSELRRVLLKNSQKFNTRLAKGHPKYSARIFQELQFVKKHMSTGNDDQDIDLATQRVDKRTELRINPTRKTTQEINLRRNPVISADPNNEADEDEDFNEPLQPLPDNIPEEPEIEIPEEAPEIIVTPPEHEAPEELLENPPPPHFPPETIIDEIEADAVHPAVVAPAHGAPAAAHGAGHAAHGAAGHGGHGHAAAEHDEDHYEDDDIEAEDEAEHVSLAEMRFNMAIVDRSVDVRKRAKELAETQLREQLRRPVGYNPMEWAKKAHLRIFEEYYRQQYIQRATKEMLQNNNSYLEMDLVNNAITEAQKLNKFREQSESGSAKAQEATELLKLGLEGHIGIAEQKVQEANPEVRKLFIDHLLKPIVQDMQGFTPEQLGNVLNRTDQQRVNSELNIQKTLQKWLKSTVDTRAKEELRISDPATAALLETQSVKDQLHALFGQYASRGIVGDFFASDVMDVAHQIESDRRAHHFAVGQLDAMLERTNVALGNMSWAAESKANFNLADTLVAWSQRGKFRGALLNPASVGAMVSVGSFFTLRAPSMLGKAAHLAAPGVGGLAGGMVAALRRSYDLKVDRASHQVDRTYGAQAVTRAEVDSQLSGSSWMKKRLAEAGGAYRRADLEALAYDTKQAQDLINGIDTSRGLDLTQENNRNILFNQLAEVRARMNFSASQKVDLIQFAGRENVEQQRLGLIKKIAEGRKALIDAGITSAQVQTRLNDLSQIQEDNFAVNRNQKDSAFLRYRIGESLKAGATGSVAGLASGLVGEQIITWGRRGVEVVGTALTGHSIGQNVADTNLEHLIRKTGELARGGKTETPQWQPTKLDLEHLYEKAGGGDITLSKDLQLNVDTNHHITFIDRSSGAPIRIPAGIIKENGDMVFTGKLPEPLQHELRAIHFTVAESTVGIPKSLVPEGAHEEFLPNHPDMATGNLTFIPEGTEWVHDGDKWDLVMITDHSHMVLNDVVFNSHGVITSWDHATGIGATIDTGKFLDNSHEIMAPTGEWKEHGVKLDRYEWYSYDKAGSQGNELKLYTYKDGDTVTLSMHDMGKAWQSGMNPREINVPDVYQGLPSPGGQAGYAFSLPGHLKEPIIALSDDKGFLNLNVKDVDPTHFVKYIDTDGVTKQMQTAEFSQMVLNYDAYKGLANGNIATELNGRFDVWKVGGKTSGDDFGFISAGRFVDQDGKNVWQSFATIRGKGETSPIIQQIAESAKINLIKELKITTTEVTPPLESVPFAVPFAPRYPLDAVETARLTYYYAGLPTQSERLQYEERRSPRLRTNPRAILDPVEEIRWYIEQQPQEFRNELHELNNRIGEQMHDECRIAICMPVASHQEGANIYNTLLNYTDQRDEAGNVINNNSFEIVLFLNRPQNSIPDNTKSEVERFKREHPEIKVRVLEKTFPVRPKFGVLTKYINDMALFRSVNRTTPINNDLILVTNDADADLISKGYINAIISEYDNPEKQHIDAALGKLEWDPESYIKYPGFHVANRFIQFVEAGMRHDRDGKNKHIGSSGANFTLKSSIYAGVGGYLSDVDAGVDTHLGRMIKAARKPLNTEYNSNTFPIDYMGNAWLVTSPRRGISYYTRGEPIVRQWNDFGTRQGVRENNWKSSAVTTETIDTLDPIHIQNDINAVIEDYGLNSQSRLVRRTLDFLGFRTIEECQERIDKLHGEGKDASSPDTQALLLELGIPAGNYHIDGNRVVIDKAGYKVEDGRITITDLTKAKALLQKYKDDEMEKINQRKNQNIVS